MSNLQLSSAAHCETPDSTLFSVAQELGLEEGQALEFFEHQTRALETYAEILPDVLDFMDGYNAALEKSNKQSKSIIRPFGKSPNDIQVSNNNDFLKQFCGSCPWYQDLLTDAQARKRLNEMCFFLPKEKVEPLYSFLNVTRYFLHHALPKKNGFSLVELENNDIFGEKFSRLILSLPAVFLHLEKFSKSKVAVPAMTPQVEGFLRQSSGLETADLGREIMVADQNITPGDALWILCFNLEVYNVPNPAHKAAIRAMKNRCMDLILLQASLMGDLCLKQDLQASDWEAWVKSKANTSALKLKNSLTWKRLRKIFGTKALPGPLKDAYKRAGRPKLPKRTRVSKRQRKQGSPKQAVKAVIAPAVPVPEPIPEAVTPTIVPAEINPELITAGPRGIHFPEPENMADLPDGSVLHVQAVRPLKRRRGFTSKDMSGQKSLHQMCFEPGHELMIPPAFQGGSVAFYFGPREATGQAVGVQSIPQWIPPKAAPPIPVDNEVITFPENLITPEPEALEPPVVEEEPSVTIESNELQDNFLLLLATFEKEFLDLFASAQIESDETLTLKPYPNVITAYPELKIPNTIRISTKNNELDILTPALGMIDCENEADAKLLSHFAVFIHKAYQEKLAQREASLESLGWRDSNPELASLLDNLREITRQRPLSEYEVPRTNGTDVYLWDSYCIGNQKKLGDALIKKIFRDTGQRVVLESEKKKGLACISTIFAGHQATLELDLENKPKFNITFAGTPPEGRMKGRIEEFLLGILTMLGEAYREDNGLLKKHKDIKLRRDRIKKPESEEERNFAAYAIKDLNNRDGRITINHGDRYETHAGQGWLDLAYSDGDFLCFESYIQEHVAGPEVNSANYVTMLDSDKWQKYLVIRLWGHMGLNKTKTAKYGTSPIGERMARAFDQLFAANAAELRNLYAGESKEAQAEALGASHYLTLTEDEKARFKQITSPSEAIKFTVTNSDGKPVLLIEEFLRVCQKIGITIAMKSEPTTLSLHELLASAEDQKIPIKLTQAEFRGLRQKFSIYKNIEVDFID